MFYLLGKKVIVFITIVFSFFSIFAQNPYAYSTKNMPDYDEQKLHYGFSIALNYSKYNIIHSQNFIGSLGDTVLKVSPVGIPSFTLGFIMNYAINDQMDLRAEPGTVSFYARTVDYTFIEGFNPNDERPKQEIESTMIELPILFKYKSLRHKNFRMYMIGGIKPGIAINNRKKLDRESILRVNPTDFAIEYGFGFDSYYPMFKWSPEIRFSHGIPNLLVNDNNVFARSLQRLSTHTVTFYFHFE